LWQIWKSRNDFVFRQHRPNPQHVVQLALANARSALICNSAPLIQQQRKTDLHLKDRTQIWRPPEFGVIKINIDGAYPTSHRQGAVACVCRDSVGHLLDGFTCTVTASEALETEAQAFNLTLKFLLQKRKNHDHILLESDCSVLVDAVRNPNLIPWKQEALFAEALSFLP